MDKRTRSELAIQALDGYVHGAPAAVAATTEALEKVAGSRGLVLVEGISDQIAVETVAARYGRNLGDEGIVVLPIGGANAITNYVERFGPNGANLSLAGLCDAKEAEVFRRGLRRAGVATLETNLDMARLGFHICVDDLEDELIRAAGPERVEALFESQGDLGPFRTLQGQPAWRDQPVAAQMRRFLGAGARRKLRYARLLVGALPIERVPRPLEALLAHI